MFIDTQSDIQARKNCLALFGDLKIKSLNEIREHELPWDELCKMEKRFSTTARNLLNKVNEKLSDEEMHNIDGTVDTLTDALGSLRYEKDQRTELGSKEPRAMGGSNKRPGAEAGRADPGGFESEAAETSFALMPEERFRTWAQARPGANDNLRGLSLGSYLRSMIVGAKTDVEQRALAEGTDSSGGFTTPNALSAELIDLLRAQSVIMKAGARTLPLTSDSNSVAKLLSDPVPAWRSENAPVAESDPTFDNVLLVPRSLAVLVKVSLELIQDSLNIERELPRIMAAALAVELDRVGLLGTGTPPEPEGVANWSGISTAALAADLTGYAPFIAGRTAIKTANGSPTAIILHPRDEGTLSGLLDSTGQPLIPPKAVSDIPMLTTTSIPVDGGGGTNESTVFIGDFSKMLVGIRQEIRIDVSKEVFMGNLQYGLVAHLRADIATENAAVFHTITAVTG